MKMNPQELIEAFAGSNAETVEALLHAGANVNMPGENGFTPLMAAAKAGNKPMMTLALEKGARIDERDNDGMTALMYAAGSVASYGGKGVLLLLEAGADAELVSNNSKTAVSIAEELSRGDNVRMINNYPEMKAAKLEAERIEKVQAAARLAARQEALRDQARRLKPPRP